MKFWFNKNNKIRAYFILKNYIYLQLYTWKILLKNLKYY